MSSPITPDAKDWTWVLERPCPECGFDAATHSLSDLATLLHDTAMVWSQVLRSADADIRPDADTWSPLEYACHVRDVHQVFAGRVRSMLDQDTPTFADWDQDRAAVEDRYDEQQPFLVDLDLIEAAGDAAGLYASVRGEDRHRRGRRSDGTEFTIEELGRYHLHDVVHHLHDVGHDPLRSTIRSYDQYAAAYRDHTSAITEDLRAAIEAFAARLGAGAQVLEIGSGGGRDALGLEAAGLRVRRTDITPAFVALLREAGHQADVVDPLHDQLGPPASYDGVWASACLLHVERVDFPVVLQRLAEVTRAGGALHVSLKEGDGVGWSTHGSIGSPRRFVYWREEPLRAALAIAGWQVEELTRGEGRSGEPWLEVRALRVGAA